jgi:hypothetical protein
MSQIRRDPTRPPKVYSNHNKPTTSLSWHGSLSKMVQTRGLKVAAFDMSDTHDSYLNNDITITIVLLSALPKYDHPSGHLES